MKMLNTSKGPAVYSLRAQADRKKEFAGFGDLSRRCHECGRLSPGYGCFYLTFPF